MPKRADTFHSGSQSLPGRLDPIRSAKGPADTLSAESPGSQAARNHAQRKRLDAVGRRSWKTRNTATKMCASRPSNNGRLIVGDADLEHIFQIFRPRPGCRTLWSRYQRHPTFLGGFRASAAALPTSGSSVSPTGVNGKKVDNPTFVDPNAPADESVGCEEKKKAAAAAAAAATARHPRAYAHRRVERVFNLVLRLCLGTHKSAAPPQESGARRHQAVRQSRRLRSRRSPGSEKWPNFVIILKTRNDLCLRSGRTKTRRDCSD